MTGAEDPAPDWRHSKWLAIGELVVVALIFLADARHLIPFSKTPFLLAFGWISLWARKIGWRDVGLNLYRNWKTSIALGFCAGLLLEALELFNYSTAARELAGQAARPRGFSRADRKSQADADLLCVDLDPRCLR